MNQSFQSPYLDDDSLNAQFFNRTKGTYSIKFAKLMLQETGTYNPMYARPYTSHADGMTVENIVNRIASSKATSITPHLLSGTVGQLTSPSPYPVSDLQIPNGWDTRRLRFIMEVHITMNTGTTNIYFFQGYTSHLGIGHDGAIDHNMDFYINSLCRVNRATMPNGIVTDLVTESAQVINGKFQKQDINKDVYTMRPSDVFSGIQSSFLEDGYRIHNPSMLGTQDSRCINGDEVIRSKRSNNIPTNYISTLINTYQINMGLLDFAENQYNFYETCRHSVNEDRIEENPFIRSVLNMRPYGNGVIFKYSDLIDIDQNIKMVTDVFMLGNKIHQLHTAGQTEFWHGADNVTMAVTSLMYAVPSIMNELMIKSIAFRSTNYDSGGIVSTTLTKALSFTNADNSRNYEAFKYRLEKEILTDITYNNQEIFSLEMSVDLTGETRIILSLGNNPEMEYACPTFCDSLVSPVGYNYKNEFDSTVSDYHNLLEKIANGTNNNRFDNGPSSPLILI